MGKAGLTDRVEYHGHMRRNTWRATKATRVLSDRQRIGWRIKRQKASHRTLERCGWPGYVFAYHDRAELGPVALEKLGKKTGLSRAICDSTRRKTRSSRRGPLLHAPGDRR